MKIQTANIGSGVITNAQIADATIETGKIKDAAIDRKDQRRGDCHRQDL